MIAADGYEWKRLVIFASGGCCLAHDDPSECELPLRAHHVITQQALRKHGLAGFRWETRNGIPVCESGHRRHHSGLERIPRERLPASAIAFADEVGLDWMIDRYYPSEENQLG